MELYDVVKKLTGNIRPVGESNTDTERFENLKTLCELVEKLVIDIDAVGYDFRDSYEASVKKASLYAQEFMTKTLGVSD